MGQKYLYSKCIQCYDMKTNRAKTACKIHKEKLHTDLGKTANLILSFQVKVT